MAISALIVALAPSPSPTGTASDFLNRPEAFWTGWAAIGTILGAVATFAAVMVSLVAVKHQRDRENDLRMSEADRQKRSQADYVAAWYHYGSGSVIVANQSAQAIYDAYAVLVRHSSDGDGHSPQFTGMLRVVPPGKEGFVPIPPGWAGMSFSPGTVLTFRDSQGITWQRTNMGHLKELHTDVFQHYGLSLPMGYVDDSYQPWGPQAPWGPQGIGSYRGDDAPEA